MYAFTCLVERAWRFGLPLVLVDIPGQHRCECRLGSWWSSCSTCSWPCAGGFQTVALVGFIAPLAVTLLGPATGQLLDHSPRQLALNTCALVQGGCIIISGQILQAALSSQHTQLCSGEHEVV